MLELAKKNGFSSIPLKEIAEHIDISEKYLWHLVRMLKNAGLVQSLRGSNGGYTITRPIDQITLQNILSALEGPVELGESERSGGASIRSMDCPEGALWAEVSGKISNTLISYTLKDMLEMQKPKRPGSDYSI